MTGMPAARERKETALRRSGKRRAVVEERVGAGAKGVYSTLLLVS